MLLGDIHLAQSSRIGVSDAGNWFQRPLCSCRRLNAWSGPRHQLLRVLLPVSIRRFDIDQPVWIAFDPPNFDGKINPCVFHATMPSVFGDSHHGHTLRVPSHAKLGVLYQPRNTATLVPEQSQGSSFLRVLWNTA